jgi:hypothetical protein
LKIPGGALVGMRAQHTGALCWRAVLAAEVPEDEARRIKDGARVLVVMPALNAAHTLTPRSTPFPTAGWTR